MTEADKSSVHHGYSLWLVPPISSKASTQLHSAIQSLAFTYKTSVFSPHVTLMPSISLEPVQIAGVLEEVVREFQKENEREEGKEEAKLDNVVPIEITGEVVTKDLYFQSVVLAAQSARLFRLNAICQRLFDHTYAYWPHLSLVYSNLPAETRDEIVRFVKTGLWVGVVGDEDCKWNEIVSFAADRVLIMRTKGRVEEWEQVGEVLLG